MGDGEGGGREFAFRNSPSRNESIANAFDFCLSDVGVCYVSEAVIASVVPVTV